MILAHDMTILDFLEEEGWGRAQNLRGTVPPPEQILRSPVLDCGELRQFSGWHAGCMGQVSSRQRRERAPAGCVQLKP